MTWIIALLIFIVAGEYWNLKPKCSICKDRKEFQPFKDYDYKWKCPKCSN